MIILPIVGFLIIGVGNYASSRIGFSNFITGDKDILFPFATTSFLFFSLLIYLPEVHLIWCRSMEKSTTFSPIRPILKSNFKRQRSKKIFPLLFSSHFWPSIWQFFWISSVLTSQIKSKKKTKEISTVQDRLNLQINSIMK